MAVFPNPSQTCRWLSCSCYVLFIRVIVNIYDKFNYNNKRPYPTHPYQGVSWKTKDKSVFGKLGNAVFIYSSFFII